jgi:hypothetical protein
MSSGILGGLFGGPGGVGILGQGDFMDAMANPQAARQYQPGLLTGFSNFAQDNGAALMNMSAALLDGEGWGGAMRGYAQGQAQDERTRLLKQKRAQDEQLRTAARQEAQKHGIDPILAEANPDFVFRIAERKYTPKEPTEWERLTQGLSPDEVNQAKRFKLGLETKPTSTDDIREYEYARGQGFQGTFPQFLQAKRGGASNAPSGYTYGPDGKLAPIPGGPQDPNRDINDPLPGELGARIGLANEYFKRFPRIEADLRSKDPRSVGPIDGLGFGQSGAIQRDIKLGSEAMIRMLTGAGMNKEEAENEVKQYLPGRGDDAATVLDKQYRLRAALRTMQREMLTGRRSRRQLDELYPEFESPEFSEVEKRAGSGRRVPIGQNRASAGAQRAINGQTRSGVTWQAR